MNHIKTMILSAGLILACTSGVHVILDAKAQQLTWVGTSILHLENSVKSNDLELLRLREQFNSQRSRRNSLRESLASEEIRSESEPPGPSSEGIWPVNRPYFYFPKELISKCFILAAEWTKDGYKLNPQLIEILALSPNETLMLEQGLNDVVKGFQSIQKQHFQKLPVTNADLSPTDKSIISKDSYSLPVLRPELDALLAPYFSEAEKILGIERFTEFQHRTYIFFDEAFYGGGKDALVVKRTEEKWDGPNRGIVRIQTFRKGKIVGYAEILKHEPKSDHHPMGRFDYLFNDDGKVK